MVLKYAISSFAFVLGLSTMTCTTYAEKETEADCKAHYAEGERLAERVKKNKDKHAVNPAKEAFKKARDCYSKLKNSTKASMANAKINTIYLDEEKD